ncbi:MAG TPA: hypothetical protein VKZ46_03330 [Pedomonas sp.]|nr:hypothetical protein [Pedomonas sp.]
MALFRSGSKQADEGDQRRALLLAKREAQERFAATPAGQARRARQSGRSIFQIDLSLSATRGAVLPMVTAYSVSTEVGSAGNAIEAIEAEGWRLEHVGYVYRMTGSTSRDKFMASGQQEAVHGEIVGVYLFRATEGPAPHPIDLDADAEGRTLFDAR